MNLSRRRFLAVSGHFALFAGLSACGRTEAPNQPAANGNTTRCTEQPQANEPAGKPGEKAARFGTILGAGKGFEADTGKTAYWLAVRDLDDSKRPLGQIELDFLAHGITPNPVAPHKLVLFEKRGKGACEVDLKTLKVLRKIDTTASRQFYGHGAFTPDAALLFAAEADTSDAYKGVVAMRDGSTLELKGEFPTYGTAPHDCHLIDNGRTLVFTNGGSAIDGNSPPSVTFVDAHTHKLLDEVKFESPRINAGHCALTSAGDLAVISAPRDGIAPDAELPRQPGALTLRLKGASARTMAEPPEIVQAMLGESLSLAIDEARGVIGVTNPSGNLVTFWDYKQGRFKQKLTEFTSPRGIALTLDRSYFIVSYGDAQSQSLAWVSTATLEVKSRWPQAAMSGSHIVAYPRV